MAPLGRGLAATAASGERDGDSSPLVIAQTRYGLICASAGVDHSNAPEPGTLALCVQCLPAAAGAHREVAQRGDVPLVFLT